MTAFDYQAMLLDPRWLKLRFFKLQSVGWTCEHCGAKDRPFHIHHPKYKHGEPPWAYWITELEALCELCHAEQHGKRETDEVLQVCYQAMAEAHRRGDWNKMQRFIEDSNELLARGYYYKGLV